MTLIQGLIGAAEFHRPQPYCAVRFATRSGCNSLIGVAMTLSCPRQLSMGSGPLASPHSGYSSLRTAISRQLFLWDRSRTRERSFSLLSADSAVLRV